jgi:hypothetical protein
MKRPWSHEQLSCRRRREIITRIDGERDEKIIDSHGGTYVFLQVKEEEDETKGFVLSGLSGEPK